jgi:hypothetical protein
MTRSKTFAVALLLLAALPFQIIARDQAPGGARNRPVAAFLAFDLRGPLRSTYSRPGRHTNSAPNDSPGD